jgi:hypothetical protein
MDATQPYSVTSCNISVTISWISKNNPDMAHLITFISLAYDKGNHKVQPESYSTLSGSQMFRGFAFDLDQRPDCPFDLRFVIPNCYDSNDYLIGSYDPP